MKNVEINTRRNGNARHAIVAAGLAMFAVVLLLPSSARAQCMTPPAFAGIGSVTNPANATCTLHLTWSAATPTCGGTVVYSIYRSTTKNFAADASTRIASDVSGTTHDDNADLVSGTRYYYKVRARSSANWIEDANIVEKSGTSAYEWSTPVIFRDTFDLPDRPGNPAAWWTFGVFAGDNDNKSDIWLSNLCGAYSGSYAYRFGQQGQCNKYSSKEESSVVLGGDGSLDPAINGFNVPANVENAQLKFMHRYALEDAHDGGHLMYSLTSPTVGYIEIPDTFTPGQPFIETGGYDGVIPTTTGPVRAWTGIHTTWTPVVVNIAELTGKKVWFVWRFSTDNTNAPTWPAPAQTGYWFDDIQVDWTIASGSCVTCPSPVKLLTTRAGSYTNGSGVQRGSVKLEWTAGANAVVWIERNGSFLALASTDASGYGSFVDQDLNLGSTYTYTAAVDYNSQRSLAKSASATPQDSTTRVKWSYKTSATSFAAQTISGSVFTVSNDRAVHAMNLGNGGGDWPRNPAPRRWIPAVTNAPAQARSPVLDVSAYPIGSATRAIFVSSLDGRVYCIDANTGATVWSSQVLGEMLLTAPGLIFRQYGSTLAKDLLIVGTRNSSAPNTLYALDAASGIVQWSFTNGGGANGIGIITAMPTVDTALRRVYFTSYRMTGGSQNTVWAVDFTATSATFRWASPFGDSATTPWRRAANVIVGNNSGQVAAFAQNATGSVSPVWTFATGDGPIKGNVIADRLTTRLYFASATRVWCVLEGAVTETWKTDATGANAIASPSAPTMRATELWVGSTSGDLVKIDAINTATPTISRIALGGGAVGAPAIDFQNALVHVGTESGSVFAVAP